VLWRPGTQLLSAPQRPPASHSRRPKGIVGCVTSDFAGSTARHYRTYRRDVPPLVVQQLVDAVGLSTADRVLDLGCGTGQLAVPLAARVGAVFAVDPEPDMLAQLYGRLSDEHVSNVVTVLAADKDLPTLAAAFGHAPLAAITVANALHWMNAETVFTHARTMLRSGGGVVIITQGPPIWLADDAWAHDLRRYLESWTGPSNSSCGTDRDTLDERRQLLARSGFRHATVFEHSYDATIDVDFIVGHLHSAMSPTQIPQADKAAFEAGLRNTLAAHATAQPMVEHVQVTMLVGHV
jgi:ubiquinone/menaquinone biosynthesis C-methylase UbiE